MEEYKKISSLDGYDELSKVLKDVVNVISTLPVKYRKNLSNGDHYILPRHIWDDILITFEELGKLEEKLLYTFNSVFSTILYKLMNSIKTQLKALSSETEVFNNLRKQIFTLFKSKKISCIEERDGKSLLGVLYIIGCRDEARKNFNISFRDYRVIHHHSEDFRKIDSIILKKDAFNTEKGKKNLNYISFLPLGEKLSYCFNFGREDYIRFQFKEHIFKYANIFLKDIYKSLNSFEYVNKKIKTPEKIESIVNEVITDFSKFPKLLDFFNQKYNEDELITVLEANFFVQNKDKFKYWKKYVVFLLKNINNENIHSTRENSILEGLNFYPEGATHPYIYSCSKICTYGIHDPDDFVKNLYLVWKQMPIFEIKNKEDLQKLYEFSEKQIIYTFDDKNEMNGASIIEYYFEWVIENNEKLKIKI